MSSSDARLFDAMTTRVASLEDQVVELAARIVELEARVVPKEMTAELYGETADHTADREARRGGLGRPPERKG